MAHRDAVQGKTLMVNDAQYRVFLRMQMGMPDDTAVGLMRIVGLDNITKFGEMKDKSDWERAHDQLKKPPGRFIPSIGVRGTDDYRPAILEPAEPINFSAMSMERCRKAVLTLKYHKLCRRPLTVENMHWNIIEQVAEQMDVFEKQDVDTQNWKVIKVVNNNLCDWEEKAKQASIRIDYHPPEISHGGLYSRFYDSR